MDSRGFLSKLELVPAPSTGSSHGVWMYPCPEPEMVM